MIDDLDAELVALVREAMDSVKRCEGLLSEIDGCLDAILSRDPDGDPRVFRLQLKVRHAQATTARFRESIHASGLLT